ncbi:MAG: hypothetical protein KatS3mg103_1367 [Phycisphaerales bacterium]|nr:MAG: hypothetical protein KatS3mg103_1367 [Phycisphaerales bacterium]
MVLSVVLAPASVGLVHLVWQTRMARQELRSIHAQLRSLGEQAALSDDARRVLHRTRERTLLRRAIEEDIAAEDWDAALVLARRAGRSLRLSAGRRGLPPADRSCPAGHRRAAAGARHRPAG